jgi:hypothetical protein
MFCAAAAKKNCHEQTLSPEAQATQSDLILAFRE